MIRVKSRALRYAEVWSGQPEAVSDVDVVYRFRAADSTGSVLARRYCTILVDLRKSEDEIFADFRRPTRAQIRRAEKEDRLRVEMIRHPSKAQLEEFASFYSEFAKQKGLAPVSADYLENHRSSDAILLTRVATDDNALVYHLYVLDGTRAVLYRSASRYRHRNHDYQSLVGRANRLLTWRGMVYLKGQGFYLYDLCGWYEGSEDRELMNVNQFKEGFGGAKAVEYKKIELRSWRARLLWRLGLLKIELGS